MASDNEASCESDPNFAVICGFLEKFGVTCGLTNIDFLDLQDMLENNQEVPQELVDLHIKLLRKARKSVSSERWERAIIKLCHGFCSQDAWEIERFGYKKARLSSKLRILKELLEMQFDYNVKFKSEINKLSAEELRTQPLGRDRLGHAYWFQSDDSCQIRVYKEDPDEETWALVARDREGLVNLITQLNDGKEILISEDSNSLESEKPVVDTGQMHSNSTKMVQSSTDSNNVKDEVKNEKSEVTENKKVQNEEDISQNIDVLKPDKIEIRKDKLSNNNSNSVHDIIHNTEGNNEEAEVDKNKSLDNNDDKDIQPSLVASQKANTNLRIKPISELISSNIEVNKKPEITGVKEKYIRSDPSSLSNSGHHRKAVDSAGFDVHTNYLKRPIEEEEDVKEPSYLKRPRLDRPKLLGNKRKKPSSDEEEDDSEVSGEVEEPLMLVKGEGFGHDNENGNNISHTSPDIENNSPIIGEAIEEPILYFYGEGVGHECETGNDNIREKEDADNQEKENSSGKEVSTSETNSSKLELQNASQIKNKADTIDSIKGDNSLSNVNTTNNLLKTSPKNEIKLGTIIDVRANKLISNVTSPVKKSRWDVGKPEEALAIESQVNIEKPDTCEAIKSLPEENYVPEKVPTMQEQIKCNLKEVSDAANVLQNKTQDLKKYEELSALQIEKEEIDKSETSKQNVEIFAQTSVDKEMSSSLVDTSSKCTLEEPITPKKSVFFFGPGCLQVKPIISSTKSASPVSSEQTNKTPEMLKSLSIDEKVPKMDQSENVQPDNMLSLGKQSQHINMVNKNGSESDVNSEKVHNNGDDDLLQSTAMETKANTNLVTKSATNLLKPNEDLQQPGSDVVAIETDKVENECLNLPVREDEGINDQQKNTPLISSEKEVLRNEDIAKDSLGNDSVDITPSSCNKLLNKTNLSEDDIKLSKTVTSEAESSEKTTSNDELEKVLEGITDVCNMKTDNVTSRNKYKGSLVLNTNFELKSDSIEMQMAIITGEKSSDVNLNRIIDKSVDSIKPPTVGKSDPKSEAVVIPTLKNESDKKGSNSEVCNKFSEENKQASVTVSYSSSVKKDTTDADVKERVCDEPHIIEVPSLDKVSDEISKEEKSLTSNLKLVDKSNDKTGCLITRKEEISNNEVVSKDKIVIKDNSINKIDDLKEQSEEVKVDISSASEVSTKSPAVKDQPEVVDVVKTSHVEVSSNLFSNKQKAGESEIVVNNILVVEKSSTAIEGLVENKGNLSLENVEIEKDNLIPQDGKLSIEIEDERNLSLKESVVLVSTKHIVIQEQCSTSDSAEVFNVSKTDGEKVKNVINTLETTKDISQKDDFKAQEVENLEQAQNLMNKKLNTNDTISVEAIQEKETESVSKLKNKLDNIIDEMKNDQITCKRSDKPRTKSFSDIVNVNEDCSVNKNIDDEIKNDTEDVKNIPSNSDVNIKDIETQTSKKLKLSDNVDVSKKMNDSLQTKESKVEEVKDAKEIEVELKPVDEPKCIKKKVALLTCVDINKLKDQLASEDVISESTKNNEERSIDSPGSERFCDLGGDGDSSDSVTVIPEIDPLAESDGSEGINNTSKSTLAPMTLATFKLDTEELPPISPPMRMTRKRAAQQSVDSLRTPNKERTENKKQEDGNKRPKLKGKRSVDHDLRRSIEEQKSKQVSSSEDDNVDQLSTKAEPQPKQEVTKKSKGVSKRRTSTRSNRTTDSPIPSSDAPSETSRTDTSNTPPATKVASAKRKKTLLGLDITPEQTENLMKEEPATGVRQSRRIAQLKIKEEAERRKLEEVTLQELKEEQRKRKGKKEEDKDYKIEKKKRSKNIPSEDDTTNDAESEEKKKRKRKRKHGDPRKNFDAGNPWKSSSGSSSSEIEEEEEEIEPEEDYDQHVVLKSDHEFSPESDLEEGGEIQPLKRARTARKESDAEEEIDDCACQKCGQKDHPEWILLCDSCDSGWHCSCLRPALLVIPEGDWFCPPCQHATLVKNLESRLIDFDKKINKKEMEVRRKERLAYVGISLDNVLPTNKESDDNRQKVNSQDEEDDDKEREDSASEGSESEDGSGSETESSSSSESEDEPIYQLRERRQAHSYRFNDYDELINSAIQDELEAVNEGAGNQGRGKDIATIVNAEKEEAEADLKSNEATEGSQPDFTSTVNESIPPQPLPPVVPSDHEEKLEYSDDEPIHPVRKMFGKKKHRKLNSLDVSSGDDPDSDEDFKGTSTSESEEEFDEEELMGSDSSEEYENRRGKRRKDVGPIRRSTRARTSRYDREFINDETESEEEAPRRKKTKAIWDDSESEESDRSWGRKKRKNTRSKRKPSSVKVKKAKRKKKKRAGDDSDPEVYRKKPNIKFGGLNDDEEIGRRTRGKKINYLEALGTDSEDEMRRKPPRIEESEEEFVIHEDDYQNQLDNDKDSDESGVEHVLQDIPRVPRPKPRGRGKCGLKIPRKPKEVPPMDFPSTIPDFSQPPQPLQAPGVESESSSVLQPLITQPLLQQQQQQELPIKDQETQDIEEEPNPIEQINKNVEEMNEQEMEKMMEEEDYANKQLQLVALQIEKEKKRKEREAKRLESLAQEQKTPKKRGRKPKNQMLGMNPDVSTSFNESGSLLMNSMMTNNAELSEPPGISLPMFSDIAPILNTEGTPKKRRGRGKGKKTLAAEAAAAAAISGKDNPDGDSTLEGQASSGSNTVSPAPDSPMHGSKLGIAAPPQPFSQNQPAPSVITRMLQSQPGQTNFPGGASKYFGSPSDPILNSPLPGATQYHPGANGPRGPIAGPYQQSHPGMPHFPVVRGSPAPPHRLHTSSPGPPNLPSIYHAHRSMDPSPSGGGPINVSTGNRDRHSPAIVPPASSSPLSKGEPTPPPPPPYTRPQIGHFPPGTVSSTSTLTGTGSRHVPMVPPHIQQHRGGNVPPYHSGVPSNYYGSYPPPSLTTEEGQQPPPVYTNPGYTESYPSEGGPPTHPPENASGKSFEDDTGGEFVGLVSYFSSQREDDLDT